MKKIKAQKIDKIFLWLTLFILAIGLLSFASASLSVLAENKSIFYGMIKGHIILGLIGGLITLWLFSKINYNFWKKFSIPIFILAIGLTLLVFVDGLGFEYGGAKRWINFGFITFQPAEILKFSFVIILATWFSIVKEKVRTFKFGLLPFLLFLSVSVGVLIIQPDTGTSLVIIITGFAMYIISGARWRDILIIFLVIAFALGLLVSQKTYLKDRIRTFFDHSSDILGSSYQINQAKIAIGSGGLFGVGLGQSIQKFDNYLPEPAGDSVFAIFAEEWGFLGSSIFVILLLIFFFRGLSISQNTRSFFARHLSAGFIVLIVSQSFVNIAAISGIIPLTGLPLTFVSHGGTALFISLAEIGIILNVSKFKKINKRSKINRN